MLAKLKKIELRLKAKGASKPTTAAPRPPSAVQEPSAVEPSAVAPQESWTRMLAATVPAFLLGTALVVWALRPGEPPPVEVTPAPAVRSVPPPTSPSPEEPPYERPDEPAPKPGGELTRLTRSYLDKVSRMTPDERSKLYESVKKFTDMPDPLTPDQKRSLTERPTNPKDDADLAVRLRMARRWLVDLALARKDVSAWENAPAQIQKQMYSNPLRAAQRLDRMLKQIAAAEKK